ncbi:hypothetical protein ACWGJX_39940 [Streptomyces sp. NPDC054775]
MLLQWRRKPSPHPAADVLGFRRRELVAAVAVGDIGHGRVVLLLVVHVGARFEGRRLMLRSVPLLVRRDGAGDTRKAEGVRPGLGDLTAQVFDRGADLTEVADHLLLPAAQFAVLLPHTGRAVGDMLQDLAVPALLYLVQCRNPGMGISEHLADLAEFTDDLVDVASCHAHSLRDDRHISFRPALS